MFDKRAYDRRRHLRRAYGLTEAEAQALLDAQEGRCAICGEDEKRMHIDHDHMTGRVRAILCHSCNQGLGKFRECPELLEAAASYLYAAA